MGKARRPTGPKPGTSRKKGGGGLQQRGGPPKKSGHGDHPSRDRAALMKAEIKAQKAAAAATGQGPPKARVEEEDEELPIADDDLEFFDEHQHYANFLGNLEGTKLGLVGKRHRTKEEKLERRVRLRPEAVEEDDEGDGMRKASTKGWERPPVTKSKPRLPIKTVDGKILPLVDERHEEKEEAEEAEEEVDDNQEGKEEEEEESQSDEEEPDDDDDDGDDDDGFDDVEFVPIKKRPTSSLPLEDVGVDLNLSRSARLEQKKGEIAATCEEILEDPEESLMKPCGAGPGGKQQTRMQRILGLLQDDDRAVQQLAVLSLLAVFRDILPSYRIRVPTEKELSQKVSKDVKRVREYERAMLGSYQTYLKHLEALINQRARGASSPNSSSPLPRLALRCLCELLCAAPYFNFASNILSCLVKQATCRGRTVEALAFRKASCQALRQLFEKDIQGDTSLTAVRLISKELKNRQGKPGEAAELMMTLLSLKLRVHEDEVSAAKRRAFKEMKRVRHLKDKGDDVEAGLKEAEGRVDPVLRAKFQAESLQEVTLIYFRVLKQKPPNPRLLPAALEGLARVAHLINLDTVQDLVGVLKELLALKATLPPLCSLHCVLTGLRTLQGPGRELRVDDKELITALYGQLGRIRCRATLTLACTCLRAALIERREYSLARVAAFYKRLMAMALATEPRETQAVLLLAKEINVMYPGLDAMLEGEQDRVSTGEFKPDVVEPELSNALASGVWELGLLSKHFHPQVKASISVVKKGSAVTADTSVKVVRGQDAVGEILRRSDEEALRLSNLFIRVPKPNPLHQLVSKQQSSGAKARMFFIRSRPTTASTPLTVGGAVAEGELVGVDGHAACRSFYRRTVRHRGKVQLCRELQGIKRVLSFYHQERAEHKK